MEQPIIIAAADMMEAKTLQSLKSILAEETDVDLSKHEERKANSLIIFYYLPIVPVLWFYLPLILNRCNTIDSVLLYHTS